MALAPAPRLAGAPCAGSPGSERSWGAAATSTRSRPLSQTFLTLQMLKDVDQASDV